MRVVALMDMATSVSDDVADAATTKAGALEYLLGVPADEVKLALRTAMDATRERMLGEYGTDSPAEEFIMASALLTGIELGVAAERLRVAA